VYRQLFEFREERMKSRRMWMWARDNSLFWLNLILIAVSVLIIFVWPGPMLPTGASDLRLRAWGLVLQLLGIVTVWRDLTDTARRFGKRSFLNSTLAWLRAFLTLGIAPSSATVETAEASDKVSATVRRPILPNAPLEERVAALEINLSRIDEDLSFACREIDRQGRELTAKIEAERDERNGAIERVKGSLEDAVAGNLATLAFGVAWLAVGVVLATCAPEIVKIVAGQWSEVLHAL
jgi:hypothetical protein